LWSANPYWFIALAVVAIMLGMHEFYSLAQRVDYIASAGWPLLRALQFWLVFSISQFGIILGALVVVTIVSLIIALSRPSEFEQSIPSVAATVFGVVYVPLLMGFAVAIKLVDNRVERLGSKLLGFVFLVVIASDVGAYFTGRAIGKHKLAPNISPGKNSRRRIRWFGTGNRRRDYFEKALFCRTAMVAYGSAVDYSGRCRRFW